MAQLNFFSPFLKQQKKASPRRYKSIIIFVVFALIVGSFLALQLRLYLLKEQIVENEKYLQSAEMTERVETKRNYDKLLITYNDAQKIVQAIKDVDFVNFEILHDIMVAVPQNMYFQKIKFDKESCEITGVTNNRELIAEFQHNMEETRFRQSFVSAIEYTEFGYEFEIKGFFSEGGGSK